MKEDFEENTIIRKPELAILEIPNWLKTALVILSAMVIVACVYSGSRLKEYNSARIGRSEEVNIIDTVESILREHRPFSAFMELENYLSEHSDDANTAFEGFKMAFECGQYEYAAYFCNTYLLDKGFTDSEIEILNDYIDEINVYYDTIDAVDAVFERLSEAAAGEYADENMAVNTKNELLALLDNPSFADGIVYYYLGYYFSSDDDEAKGYLEKAYEYPPVAADAAAVLARLARQEGDFATAEKWIVNGENINAELYELLRSKATIALAKGDYENGLDMATTLYYENPDGLYVKDTYCAALYAADKLQVLEAVMAEEEAAGYVFGDDLYELINGEITVREYYVNGGEE